MAGGASQDPGQDADRLVPGQREPSELAGEQEAECHTRRERLRRQTLEQIKDSARLLLAPHHSGVLSLRAVAREIGISPSGIYRYFDSRQQLMDALARDAYGSAQAALDHAMEEAPDGDHLEQAVAQARAYRRWCLGHRAEFALLFAIEHDPSPEDPPAVDPLASGDVLPPFFHAPLEHYVRGIRTGSVDIPAAFRPADPGLSPRAEAMRAAHTPDLSPQDAAVLLRGWASLHGFVSLEIFGPLASFYADMDAAYDQHVRAVLAWMGFRPGAE